MKSSNSEIFKEACIACLTLTSFVMVAACRGFVAFQVPQLQHANSDIKITDDEASWIATLTILPNPIGSILGGVLMDLIGRKLTLQLIFIPFALAWVIIAFSYSVEMIYIGTFINGIATGACYCSSTYIAEICSPEHRGPLLGFLEPTFTFGVLLCNLLVHNLGWRASAYGYIAGSVLCLLLFALLPESPSWLVCRGRRERAAEILGWLRGCPREAERELVEIENATAEPAGGGRRPARALLGDALRSWQPLALLVGLVALQRACGCPVLESYTVRFFDALRLPPSAAVDSAAAAIYHSTANFAASFCTPFAVQRLPRRTLLALSGLVMGVSMAAVALYELRFAGRPAAAAGPPHYWALLAAVYAYDVASTLGVLPLPFVMSGELFPAEGRGLLNGLYCCFSFLISAAVVKAFPGFLAAAGIVAVTGSYALVCFATILYAQFLLPETRGKTLPEIQARYFKRGREYATTLDVD